MARSQDVFVGRAGELTRLGEMLERACDGDPSFVVVSGEAGIGKTRLLEELARTAAERGCMTVHGRAAEFERELPFGLFVDALDAYLAALDPRLLDRLAQDRLGALAAVFPSMHSIDHAVERPATTTERFVVHRAVTDLIERLAAGRPVVLLLDDLQWADGASLELINALLRRPPQAAVMIAMTLRIGQGESATLQAVRSIQQTAPVQSIELGPLSLRFISDLVGDATNVEIEQLHRHSGGNPFYAIQLARAQPDNRSAGGRRGGGVPPAVIRTIVTELDRLSPSARAFAESAAVIGDPFELDVAAATAAISEDDALQHIDELITRDMLRVTDVPRRFQFRHPLVRAAVYEAISPSVKVANHHRAATALTAIGAGSASVAVHIEQSARRGDAWAIETLRRAGDEAVNHAPESAARWFAASLRLLAGDAAIAERIGLLVSMAGSLAAIGRFSEARDAFEECLSLNAQTGGEAWVQLVVGCAVLDQLLGQHRESRERLMRAYHGLPHAQSPAGVSLLIAVASSDFYMGDFDGSLEWARRATKTAEDLGDDGLLAEALALQTMAAAWTGRIELAQMLHERATGFVDVMHDDELASRIGALNSLSTAELYLDRFTESCIHGERCLALARATQQTHLNPILVPVLGSSLWVIGQMERSAMLLDEAIDAARLVGNTQGISFSLFDRALSALMAGDLDVALERGRESVELANTFERGLTSVYAGGMYALALLESGDVRGAHALLLESGGGDALLDFAGSWRSMFLEALTRCCLALGRPTEARAAANQARRESEEFGMHLPAMMADRADAAVALAEGRFDEAVAHALSSIHHAELLGSPIFIGIARALAGHALVAANRPQEAVVQLELAATEFDALGATLYRERSEAELRALSGSAPRPNRPRGQRTHGLSALTGRELEVAQLIRDRRTNREIAQELFLGIKTVETHVRNIFNKLGVTSRVNIARVLDQVAPPPMTARLSE
jgi:ATP/maltotriose-dependent transcriptional regulator MalT